MEKQETRYKSFILFVFRNKIDGNFITELVGFYLESTIDLKTCCTNFWFQMYVSRSINLNKKTFILADYHLSGLEQ